MATKRCIYNGLIIYKQSLFAKRFCANELNRQLNCQHKHTCTVNKAFTSLHTSKCKIKLHGVFIPATVMNIHNIYSEYKSPLS